MRSSIIKTGLLGLLLSLAFVGAQALADNKHKQKRQVEPVELLVDFKIAGNFTGMTPVGEAIYTIGGPGYAPKKIFKSGEIPDKIQLERQVTVLQGAQITFSGAPTDPVVRFSCLPGSCRMTFNDGSVLVSDAGVALEGRAVNFWGPVVNSPNFDPVNGIIPIRILGCGGLKEVAGKGRLAGMVGSICFNGLLNFNQFDQAVLTGSSKCTLTLHTPANPGDIP
ncbi:MAG: hypothetical protein JSW10_10920 [Pseudomonadota bacterium]|nr:MAG: hypothetical protein JSW10_10920 [Pseudomonadota bacterium]